MLVVDSSVWINFFRGAVDVRTDELSPVLQRSEVRIVAPDLVLFEVLRGFRWDSEHRWARALIAAHRLGHDDLLLHNGRDFDADSMHRGLRSGLH